MAPTSALGAATSRPGDEIKRAVILSSEARVDAVVRELRHLQELQPVLAELEQRRSRSSVDEQQLQALERSAEQESQRALALHARVERVLAVYHEMISFQCVCVCVCVALLRGLLLLLLLLFCVFVCEVCACVSAVGLVVKYLVAIEMPRVRFPDGALFALFHTFLLTLYLISSHTSSLYSLYPSFPPSLPN